MRITVLILALLLVVLHQDWWLWNNATLLFGFLPAGLAYHMLISLAAAGLWTLAVFYAWPKWVDYVVEESTTEDKPDA
jgi:hypothetical protein